MPATRAKPFSVGQIVWIPGMIKPGMFPEERFFTFKVKRGYSVCGFVPENKTRDDRIRAVVMEVVGDTVRLLLPGELLSGSNPITAPVRWLKGMLAYDAGAAGDTASLAD